MKPFILATNVGLTSVAKIISKLLLLSEQLDGSVIPGLIIRVLVSSLLSEVNCSSIVINSFQETSTLKLFLFSNLSKTAFLLPQVTI
ncbi:hypothetical protein [Polaribacter ponticola]|uniref:Uncharacterized protein n=1 Tax=Polaribacter ponticola TaxID=2978475 RepID=A0ABT5S8M2_9FLAO|nr:hypothetical protein [Polaribacter sp. MSW5]MDD7914472.1 hypothetical protein [Polaribacter sp. MSW5]